MGFSDGLPGLHLTFTVTQEPSLMAKGLKAADYFFGYISQNEAGEFYAILKI